MKFACLISILVFVAGIANAAIRPKADDFILKPFLPQGAGRVAACLSQVLENQLPVPGQKVTLWKGPGMKASGGGQVDNMTAAYIAEVTNSKIQYAILLNTPDGNGWRYVQYTEGTELRLGLVAASLYRYADLLEVTPRNGLKEVLRVDLAPCAALITRSPLR